METIRTFSRLLQDVGRTEKPRKNGLTIVLDVGLGPSAATDLCDVAGDYIDHVKIAWGSSMISGALERKLAIYRDNGIEPMFGGTLFEYAYLHSKVDE